MKKILTKIFVIFIFIFCGLFTHRGWTSDWPMFLSNRARTSSSRQWAELALVEKWNYDMYDDAVASPVIADGILYTVARSGAVYAFDVSNGEVLWQKSLGGWIDSTPAVEGDTVYVFTKDGKLHALNADEGSINWSVDLECDGVSSPLVIEDSIYIGRGFPKNDIVRVTTTGSLTMDVFTTGQPVWSSPLYYEGHIYTAANDGSVYKLDMDLNKVWEYSTETGIFRLSSVSVRDGILYFAPGDSIREVYALDTDKSVSAKSTLLNTGGDGVYTSSVASDEEGNIYAVMSSTVQVLYCLDALSLEVNWKRELATSVDDTPYQPTPAVVDGVVYTGTENGRMKGFYTFTDDDAGILAGDQMISLEVDSSPTEIVNSPAVSDGYIANTSGSGEIVVWRARNAASITYPEAAGIVMGSTNTLKGSALAVNFEKYTLYYGEGKEPSSWNPIVFSGSPVNSGVLGNWEVSNLKDGLWTIKLFVEGGAKSGTAKTSVEVDNPPAPPLNLKTEAVEGGAALLSWEKSSDDGDGNDDVEGYNIYRAPDSTENFNYSGSVDTLPAGSKSFFDDEIESFTTYYYMVRSFDSRSESENSGMESIYIDESYVWFDIPAKEGGTAKIPDGTGVYFPPESLEEDSRVKIEPVSRDNIPEGSSLSPWKPTALVWRFRVEPDRKFNKPARIELAYGDNDLYSLDKKLLRIYWFDIQDDKWRLVDTSKADPSENRVTARVNRFSYFRLGQHVGRKQLISEDTVYTYPNPAKGDTATFKFLLEKEARIDIRVFNVAGELVEKFNENYSTEDAGKWQEIEWDISNIASGVYVYRIEASGDNREDEVIKNMAIIK